MFDVNEMAAGGIPKGSTYRKPDKVLRNQLPLHLDLSLHLRNLLLKVIEEYTNNAHKMRFSSRSQDN